MDNNEGIVTVALVEIVHSHTGRNGLNGLLRARRQRKCSPSLSASTSVKSGHHGRHRYRLVGWLSASFALRTGGKIECRKGWHRRSSSTGLARP